VGHKTPFSKGGEQKPFSMWGNTPFSKPSILLIPQQQFRIPESLELYKNGI
jgi:hypothetical protein